MCDEFGWAVAIHEDTIVVGAYLNDDNGSSSGSAYVFKRNGSEWSQQQKLIASNAAAGDQFGSSVGVSAERIVVGAPKAQKDPLDLWAEEREAEWTLVPGPADVIADLAALGDVIVGGRDRHGHGV